MIVLFPILSHQIEMVVNDFLRIACLEQQAINRSKISIFNEWAAKFMKLHLISIIGMENTRGRICLRELISMYLIWEIKAPFRKDF